MDDISEKLSRLLHSPEDMARVQAALGALTGGDKSAPTAPTPSPAGPDTAALQKLLPLAAGLGQEDDDTRLLNALRPYLHGEREEKLTEALQLIRLSRLLPLLQETGLFGRSR